MKFSTKTEKMSFVGSDCVWRASGALYRFSDENSAPETVHVHTADPQYRESPIDAAAHEPERSLNQNRCGLRVGHTLSQFCCLFSQLGCSSSSLFLQLLATLDLFIHEKNFYAFSCRPEKPLARSVTRSADGRQSRLRAPLLRSSKVRKAEKNCSTTEARDQTVNKPQMPQFYF